MPHKHIFSLQHTPLRLCSAVMLLLLAMLVSCGKKTQVSDYNIIPEPAYSVLKGRSFTLSSSTRLCFQNLGQNTPTAKYIANSLRKMHVRPSFTGSPTSDCILFTINDSINPQLGDEGYLLQVKPQGIFISANTEAGLFYAFQTFVQMLPVDILNTSYRRITLQECTILDYPRFPWRGSHLDVCRHFFTVKQIEKHLDLMATYKLNRFVLTLSDDQGWRIESSKYPELNDIASFRVDRSDSPWGSAEPPRPGEEANYGGYYSKEEISHLVQYAAERNIQIIPHIELPGHCSAILAAKPQLSCTGQPQQVALGPCWSPNAVLCAGNEQTLDFLLDIIDEIVELFPSEYFHVGGSNCPKDNWETCPKCQALKHSQHFNSEEQLQGWLIGQIEQHLLRKGKRIIAYDEMTDCTGITPEALLIANRGDKNAIADATLGHPVITSPPEYCDLQYYQADSAFHPTAYPQYLTLFKAYQFDPLPHGIHPQLQPLFWGSQCQLWTDYCNTYSQAEYMLLPRLCALAECFWTQPDRKDWPLFQQKIEYHKIRLANNGYNCCKGSFKPIVTSTPINSKTLQVVITTEVDNAYVYYTTDGTTPTPESPVYHDPLQLPRGTHLRTLTLYNGQPQQGIYTFNL